VPKHQVEDRVALELQRSGNITRFAGYHGGRIVATASLFDEQAVAGIFTVATAEGHRRRGFGAAMTAAALHAGRERGLGIATLQSSPQGEPLYGYVQGSGVRLIFTME
jgi:ribosomal protein S18 acetylase RimI-like enzyme